MFINFYCTFSSTTVTKVYSERYHKEKTGKQQFCWWNGLVDVRDQR